MNELKRNKEDNVTDEYIPKIIHIDFTGRCNFSCIHCRGTYSERDLSLEKWKEILASIAGYWGDKIEWIEIGGGEPTLRKEELLSLLQFIKDNFEKAQTLLVTNGWFTTRDYIEKLYSSGLDRVQYSLDGSSAEIHDKIRRVPGSFRKVIYSIVNSLDLGLYTMTRMTVQKLNYTDVENVVHLSQDLGVKEVGIRAIVDVQGNALRYKDQTSLTLDQYEKLILYLPKLQEKYKRIRIYSGDPIQNVVFPSFWYNVSRLISTSNIPLEEIRAGCLVGVAYMFINNEGKVAWCPNAIDFILGDLANGDDVKDIWDNNVFYNRMRKREFVDSGKCSTCPFSNLCMGCRAVARFYEGDIMASDPRCTDTIWQAAMDLMRQFLPR